MIEKVVRKFDMNKDFSIRENLAYWLSRPSEDRISAVELLRRQYHGSSARLQRIARVIKQTQS